MRHSKAEQRCPRLMFVLFESSNFKYNVGLKALLREGLSELESYGDLFFEFKKRIGRN